MVKEQIFDLLHKAVDYGHKLGIDFMEARYDNLNQTTIDLTNGIIKQSSSLSKKGVGIMAYYKGTPGYSFTPDITKEGIELAAKQAANLAKSVDIRNKIKLDFDEVETIKDHLDNNVKKHPLDFEFIDKVELIKRGISTLQDNADVSSTTGLYGEIYGEKYFVNSEQSEIFWSPNIVEMRMIGYIVGNGKQARSGDSAGSSKGLEFFEEKNTTPEVLGKNAAKYTNEQLEAKSAPTGKKKTLVSPRLGGVVVHESFGHLSEADFVVTGMSPISDRVGERLGSDHVTIIDEGITEYGGLFFPYDDQGTRTEKTVLVEEGILKGYLHNRGTAKKMNADLTGNARAINFLHNPIVRMKNTYFGPGDLSFEEALEVLDTGVYAVRYSGGQVGMDGNFMFNCNRGYFVENGEIKHPIKNTALSGNILELLKHVQGATKDVRINITVFGGCGKAGQGGLPTGIGGPEVIMDQVLIGGA